MVPNGGSSPANSKSTASLLGASWGQRKTVLCAARSIWLQQQVNAERYLNFKRGLYNTVNGNSMSGQNLPKAKLTLFTGNGLVTSPFRLSCTSPDTRPQERRVGPA